MAGRLRSRRRGLVVLSTLAGLLLVGWLAPAPWLLDHWPRALAVGLFLCLFVVPRWFVPARSAASLSGVGDQAARMRFEDDRLKLQNEVRTGLLQAVAGAAVIAAVAVTWQQLETDRRQARDQLALAGQDQLAERFSRAVDQLGTGQLDVRLGGIYGLERVAEQGAGEPLEVEAGGQRSAGHRLQVFEILSAYVRAHSHQAPTGPAAAPLLQTRQVDVQAAVTVLGRRTVLPDDPPLDLGGSLLGGARLGGAKLAGADLRGADARGVILQGADLVQARLQGSLLCGAELQGADLRGAHLEGARASRSTIWPSGFDWRSAGVELVPACTV